MALRSTPLPSRSTYVRTRACETCDVERHERSRTGKSRTTNGFGHVRARAQRGRGELDLAGLVHDEHERLRVDLRHRLRCLKRHQAADLHAAHCHAERDRCGCRRWRLDRWLRGGRLSGRGRWRRGGLRRRRRPCAGRRGERESGCKSKESEDHEESCSQRASGRCHVGSVDVRSAGKDVDRWSRSHRLPQRRRGQARRDRRPSTSRPRRRVHGQLERLPR